MALESSDEEEIVHSSENTALNRIYKTPGQDALRKEITMIKVEMQSILLKKNAGLDDGEADKKLKALEKK